MAVKQLFIESFSCRIQSYIVSLQVLQGHPGHVSNPWDFDDIV